MIESELAEPKREFIGEVFANRYQIESHLGEGAMGSVYLGRHVKVGRPFAVKILHKHLIADGKTLQRFEREAELAGRLRHPNVIGVVDVGETDDGYRYMVMDFAEGLDLATLLSEAPMPAERILNLTRQMLDGLYHAHEQGLIHRDFKPENVIIEHDDHGVEVPRIVDFGIAILREGGDSSLSAGRLTTNGLVLGTPHYMAPEQAVADPIDHRIDLFALGIVIYEMLSGKLPFDGTGAEVARANLLLDPPPIAERVPYLEVDPLLEAFARRLLAKKREHRPPTAKAARELLDLIVNDPGAAAAALGVPLPVATATRNPAVTQPTAPQDLPAVALEAPSFQPTTIVPQDPARGQRGIATDLADALDYDPPPRNRRRLVFGAIGLAVAAVVIVVIAKSGGSKPAADPIVMQATDPATKEPIKDPEPPKIPIKDPPLDDPAINDPPVQPPPIKDPPVDEPKPPVKPQVKPPVKTPVVVIHDGGATKPPEVIPPVISPPITPPPELPKSPKVDGNTIVALYGEVGKQLLAVSKAKGVAAVERVSVRYRNMQVQNASKEGNREQAARDLRGMLGELATIAKQP